MLDIFFTNLRKVLVFTIVVIFAFVLVYTPQDFSKKVVPDTLAFDIDPDAPFLAPSLGIQIADAARENVLNGIAWAIAKQIVARMVSDLVDWIGSGFKGSPAFITDLDQYLLEAADQAAGQFIEELGGDASYLCSPFKLDIQVALAVEYERMRTERPYEGCTLSDIVGNLEDFLSGNFIQTDLSVQNIDGESAEDVALDNWFTVIGQPNKYTKFGVLLEEQKKLEQKVADTKAKETTKANWGDGFKSNKVCETVDNGGNNMTLKCAIVTPGRQIADRLSEKLGVGDNTLVTADEINEIIGALIAQLGNVAITGVNGILGLSQGTGYTYNGYNGGSYTSAAASEASGGATATQGLTTLQDSLQVQKDYKTLADATVLYLETYITRSGLTPEQILSAKTYLKEALIVQQTTPALITSLTTLVTKYQTLEAEYNNPQTSAARKSAIRQEQLDVMSTYITLNAYTKAQLDASKQSWDPTTF